MRSGGHPPLCGRYSCWEFSELDSVRYIARISCHNNEPFPTLLFSAYIRNCILCLVKWNFLSFDGSHFSCTVALVKNVSRNIIWITPRIDNLQVLLFCCRCCHYISSYVAWEHHGRLEKTVRSTSRAPLQGMLSSTCLTFLSDNIWSCIG